MTSMKNFPEAVEEDYAERLQRQVGFLPHMSLDPDNLNKWGQVSQFVLQHHEMQNHKSHKHIHFKSRVIKRKNFCRISKSLNDINILEKQNTQEQIQLKTNTDSLKQIDSLKQKSTRIRRRSEYEQSSKIQRLNQKEANTWIKYHMNIRLYKYRRTLEIKTQIRKKAKIMATMNGWYDDVINKRDSISRKGCFIMQSQPSRATLQINFLHSHEPSKIQECEALIRQDVISNSKAEPILDKYRPNERKLNALGNVIFERARTELEISPKSINFTNLTKVKSFQFLQLSNEKSVANKSNRKSELVEMPYSTKMILKMTANDIVSLRRASNKNLNRYNFKLEPIEKSCKKYSKWDIAKTSILKKNQFFNA